MRTLREEGAAASRVQAVLKNTRNEKSDDHTSAMAKKFNSQSSKITVGWSL